MNHPTAAPLPDPFAQPRLDATPARFTLGMQDLVHGARQHQLWLLLGWNDIRQRYKRSLLGPLWITLATAVSSAAMGLVWSALFNEQLSDFLPYIMVGSMFWSFIQASLLEGAHVFTDNDGLITQIPAALSLHVYRLVWRQCIIFAHNIPVFALVALIFPHILSVSALLVVPAFALLAVNAVSVALVLGTLCARHREFQHVFTTIVSVLFLFTPIIWDPRHLHTGAGSGGHDVRTTIVQLNPLYHFIVIARDPLLDRPVLAYHWLVVLAITAVGATAAGAMFMRYRARIAYWM